MTIVRRPPHPALAPYVDCLWHLDETSDDAQPRAQRERALPTGSMDLVFRLSEAPVRVFRDEDDRWLVGHQIEEVAPAEMQRRYTALFEER